MEEIVPSILLVQEIVLVVAESGPSVVESVPSVAESVPSVAESVPSVEVNVPLAVTSAPLQETVLVVGKIFLGHTILLVIQENGSNHSKIAPQILAEGNAFQNQTIPAKNEAIYYPVVPVGVVKGNAS